MVKRPRLFHASPIGRACRHAAASVFAAVVALLAASAFGQTARPIVILVSIDGYRWDYLDRYAPPTLSALARSGVRAEGLIPVFPSKTFPNHYSIVTGLYPERHGIVSNTMVDPNLPGRFTLNNSTVAHDTRWWGGEPLWITVEQQGQLAGTMFWPGSDIEIDGRRPRYFRPYDGDLPNEDRVDQVLAWLRQPEATRPTFLTLYFSTMDHAGHEDGPESPAIADAARVVDRALTRLVDGVRQQGLETRTNYVIVSDHGMAALSRDRTIVLDDYLDVSTIDIVDSSPVVTMNPRRGPSDAVYRALKDKHPALQVYTRDTLPEQYRLRGHPRLASVIGVADDGWHVTTRQALAREQGGVPAGTHGYDPRFKSMQGLFVAAGPQFKRGVVVAPFVNLHVYELICKVLGLRPAANDGDPTVTSSFLR
jgi:predicted AlkP superfamily pyrophosphatase or phosphodiesterase